jgi:PAS domain-containing protein
MGHLGEAVDLDTFMQKLGANLQQLSPENIPRAAVSFIMNYFCSQLLGKDPRWEHKKILNEDARATTCVSASAAIVPHESLPKHAAPSIADFPTDGSPRTKKIAKEHRSSSLDVPTADGDSLVPTQPKSCPPKFRSTRGIANIANTENKGGGEGAVLHAMVENMAMADVMAATVDEQGRFEYVSGRATMMLQYQPQEMATKSVISFIHPNDTKAATFLIGAMHRNDSGVSSTGTFKVKSPRGRGPKSVKLSERVQMRRKDGQYIWIEMKCKALNMASANLQKLLVFREVTEVVEQELHAVHER